MEHIFYTLMALYAIYEILYLFNLKNNTDNLEKAENWIKLKNYKKVEGKKEPTWDDYPYYIKNISYHAFYGFMMIALFAIGLMSTQWKLFLAMIALLLVQSLINKLVKFGRLRYITAFLFTLTSLVLTILIILNKYHNILQF